MKLNFCFPYHHQCSIITSQDHEVCIGLLTYFVVSCICFSKLCRNCPKRKLNDKISIFHTYIQVNEFPLRVMTQVRACLHEGGGPQVGDVTCGGLPHLTCKRDRIKMRYYMDRRVTPPKRVTSPTWGTPPPCKQALTLKHTLFGNTY